ncbi:MAG: TolC family protein [Terracidiphilus sp.]|nr:TolC family protein [Terracidiphilus sp.]
MKFHIFGALLLACLCAIAMAQEPVATLSTQAPEQDSGTVLRLDDVLRLAMERSPERKSSQDAIRAMKHRVTQAKALPDPTLAVGWAGKPAPFVTMSGDQSSYRGITLAEQFPYPGKLKLQGQIAARDVETAQAECNAVERRIALEVKLAFAEYAYAGQALGVAEQNKALLEKMAAIAEAQYRVSRALQQDVLRAQVEVSRQMERIEQLALQREMARAELNAALQQPPDTELPPAEESKVTPLRFTLDELYALAEANDTGLAKNKITIERGKQSVALAERQYRPDIGVGYMYQQRTDQPDMHGVTVTVSLPVFWKTKQREAVAEAVATEHGAESMQANQRNAVRTEVRKQWLAISSADRLLTLYNKAITPQSELALESAFSAYQANKLDFQSLLSNVSTQLEYKTNVARELADRQSAIARIESLTGQEIAAANVSSDGDAGKGAQQK